jgi:photosystem II stability/assembly factor-like uncharacterized protein
VVGRGRPKSPSTIFAGCRPLAFLRSEDDGARWTPLELRLPEGTERPHTPRVTAILIEDGTIWCGVEVGGVFVSEDRGRTWAPVNEGLPSLDIHALARGEALLAATPRGLARHDGEWRPTTLETPWRYCRALATLPGRTGEMLCGLGDGPPGSRGAVVISEDDGRSWRSTRFPDAAGSSVWSVGAASGVALAAAIGGELFLSEDAGRSWSRLERKFGEVRAVAIV